MTIKNRRWVVILVVLAAVLLALGFWRRSTQTLSANLAAIADMGIPTTNEQLEATTAIEGADAAPIYRDWFLKYQDSALRPSIAVLIQRMKVRTLAERSRAANDLRSLVAPLIKASAYTQWRIPHEPIVDSSGKPNFSSPTKPGTDAVKFLSNMAAVDYQTGKRKEALAELDAAKNIIRQVGQNPGMLIAIVTVSEESYVLHAVEIILKLEKNNPDVGRSMAKLIGSFPLPPSVRNAVIEEFDSELELMKIAHDLYPRESGVKNNPKQLLDDIKTDREWGLDVSMYRKAFSQLPKGEWDWQTTQGVFNNADAKFKDVRGYSGKGKSTADMMDVWANRLARRRIVLTAARLISTKTPSSKWPDTLPDFGVDSTDPYNGKPLGYKVIGTEFLVYSIGFNRVDDLGNAKRGPDGVLDIVSRF